LPAEIKRRIDGAKTENTLISSARMKNGNPDIVRDQKESGKAPTVHPLVRKNKTETVTGMSPEETQDFLQDLTDRITQPEFCYAHEYQKGDLLIIDDRASLHKAGFDYDHSIGGCIGCWFGGIGLIEGGEDWVSTGKPTENLSVDTDWATSGPKGDCRE